MSGDRVFVPESWITGGQAVQTASDDFYTAATPVITAVPIQPPTSSRVDQSVQPHDGNLNQGWHVLIANVTEQLNSDASKMESTGANYAEMEAEGTAAVNRFWS